MIIFFKLLVFKTFQTQEMFTKCLSYVTNKLFERKIINIENVECFLKQDLHKKKSCKLFNIYLYILYFAFLLCRISNYNFFLRTMENIGNFQVLWMYAQCNIKKMFKIDKCKHFLFFTSVTPEYSEQEFQNLFNKPLVGFWKMTFLTFYTFLICL